MNILDWTTIILLAVCLKENIKPSLLHGDLWSGNFLISKEGTPFLIDPAVYYGHSEVDIAMSKLFSGFGERFYEAYAEIIPFSNETTSRIEIYQLYYLLVHLNMFGRSYYGSVKSILSKHFWVTFARCTFQESQLEFVQHFHLTFGAYLFSMPRAMVEIGTSFGEPSNGFSLTLAMRSMMWNAHDMEPQNGYNSGVQKNYKGFPTRPNH